MWRRGDLSRIRAVRGYAVRVTVGVSEAMQLAQQLVLDGVDPGDAVRQLRRVRGGDQDAWQVCDSARPWEGICESPDARSPGQRRVGRYGAAGVERG